MHPSIAALSNLLWDTYIADSLSDVTQNSTQEKRILVMPNNSTFQKIKKQIKQESIQREGVGSSPTNVAIAFAALGGKSYAIGPVAAEFQENKISDYLNRHNVDLIQLTPRSVQNGQCLCFTHGRERQFCVLFPAFHCNRITMSQTIWKSVNWVTVSAYELITPQLAEFFVRELKKAHKEGVHIAFDTGDPLFVRKNIVSIKRILRTGIEVLQTGEESMHELHRLLRIKTDVKDMTWLTKLANIVILTRGERGLTVYHNKNKYVPKMMPRKVIDTTGAGDILLGSFLWAMGSGYSIKDSLKLGVLAAEEVLKIVGAHLSPFKWKTLFKNWSSEFKKRLVP